MSDPFTLTCFLQLVTITLLYSQAVFRAEGAYSVDGSIVDIRYSERGKGFTNTLSVSGVSDGKHFLVDTVPVQAEDEIAESFGWDGRQFRLIQRFPEMPGKNLPRDQSVGVVEPTPFSWYATHASAAVGFGLADPSLVNGLLAADGRFTILGGIRNYPEEKNKYHFDRFGPADFQIFAHTPGIVVRPDGNHEMSGWHDGFRRWTINVTNRMSSSGEIERVVQYMRYYPTESGLFLYRHVEAVLTFSTILGRELIESEWLPRITESRLAVRDYSGRFFFKDVSEGRIDAPVVYVLTNASWGDMSDVASERLLELQSQLGTNKLSQEVLSAATPQAYRSSRNGLLALVIAVLLVPVGYLLFRSLKR